MSTSIRGKDWVFNALWAACGSAGSNASSCILSIPITFLFQDGRPTKTITTESGTGRLKKVHLEDIVPDRFDFSDGFRGASLQPLRALRKLLDDFSMEHGYYRVQNNQEPFIARVIYTDDESENLTATKLDRLLRNDAWRQQVLLMQGYVPSISNHSGLYSKQPHVRSKLDSASNEAADQFSRSIAKYIEKAYMLQSDQLIPSRVKNGSTKVALHVENMTCVFGLDPEGQIIFLHTDYIAIEMDKQNDRLALENDLKTDKQQRELSAMETIQQELLNLLVHAHERGLSMEQSFYHFDVNHYGFIDVNTLLEGLAKLGIGVTFPVAQQLLQSISGIGSHFITFNDFEMFLTKGLQAKQQLQGHSFDSTDVSTSPSKKSFASTNKAKKMKELLPPEKDQRSMAKYALDLSMSQSQTWEHTDLLEENKKFPLALPESMYTTGGKKRQTDDSGGEPLLAPWAAKRSYHSLEKLHEGGQELIKHRQNQERIAAKKKREEEAKKAANPFGNPQDGGESEEYTKDGEEKSVEFNEDLMKSFDTQDTQKEFSRSTSKKKKQKSSANLSRSNTTNSLKLNLQTIHDQSIPQSSQALNHTTAEHGVMVNNYLKANQDEILHIDHGVMMTYRILYGEEILSRQKKTQEINEDLRYHSIMSIREQNIDILEKQKPPKSASGKRSPSPARTDSQNPDTSSTSERKYPEKVFIDKGTNIQETVQHLGATLPVNQCYSLFIVPDLMMTLDTLQLFFTPLLRTHPYIQIILVGLVGLPNTVWPHSWVINADLQAKCIAHLLKHLFDTKQIISHHLDYLLPEEMIPGFTSLTGNNTLEELKQKIPIERRMITIGFGTGGYYLARFLGVQFPVLSSEIKDSIIQVVFINSFLKMNKKLKLIYFNLRQALMKANIFEAHELILSLHFYEPNININQPTGLTTANSNDSKQYRQDQLLKFWSTRKLLQQLKDSSNETLDSKQKKKTIQDLEVLNGFGFKGILEQLKGLIVTVDDFDGATVLMNTSIPIIVVQGTEDIFIDPKHAAIYSPQQLPPTRRLIENIADTIDPNSVYMIWLKAGHEIIQERNAYILSLVSNLLKLHGVDAQHYATDEMKRKNRLSSPITSHTEEDDDTFDLLQSPSVISESMISTRSNMSRANKLKRTGSSRSTRLVSDEEKDMYDGDSLSMVFDELQPNPDEESQPVEQDIQIMNMGDAFENPEEFPNGDEEDENGDDPLDEYKAEKERKRLHKQRLLVERKKKQLKLQRQSELEIFYQREQEAYDQQHEYYERKKMAKEDYRSKCAAEYYYQCEINEASKMIAKEKAQEMKYWKKQEAVLKIEEEMNKKRCERIEQRKKQVMSIVEKIVEEEQYLVQLQKNFPDLANEKYAHSLHRNLPGAQSTGLLMDGSENGSVSNTSNEESKDTKTNKSQTPMIFGGRDARTTMIIATPEFVSHTGITNLLNINQIITTSYGLVKEFIQLRIKYLQSIQRNQVMNEKYQQFLSQMNACEYEEKRLLRAIRLIEINPGIVGAEHQAKNQLHELQHSLQLKQDIILEMKNISKQRAQEVYVNNRSVQLLKIAHYEFNLYIQTRLQELHTISTLLLHQLKQMKFQKETLLNDKNQQRLVILQQTMRIDSIDRELKRCKEIQLSQIDTDIWNPGIMQRYQKQELMVFLSQECKKLRELQQIEIDKLNDIKQQILMLSDSIALKRRDQDKMQHSVTLLTRFYQEVQTSKSIENLIEQMNNLYASAELQDKKKRKDFEMQKNLFMQNKQTTNFEEFQGQNNTIGPDGKPNSNTMSKIDKLRLKEHELRNKEEKQMIGIDLILYPENYFHLSSMESEQMSYDEAYACHLLKGDLERILKLPEYVNLALPFLFTQEEIHVHYLINKFYRNRDVNYFQQLDYYSYDTEQLLAIKQRGSASVTSGGKEIGPSLEESSQITDEYSVSLHSNLLSIMSQNNIADAEMIHEILIKESLRNRLRSSYLDESLTEEEKHFIVLDRILSPHIYGLDDDLIEQVLYSKEKNAMNSNNWTDGIAGNPSTEKAAKGLTNSVYKQASVPGKVPKQSNRYQGSRNKNDLKANTSKEGDMYEILREHFQSYEKNSLSIRLGCSEEDLFHYHWSCPYNKKELLDFYKAPVIELTDDQKYIKELMNKYYISDEETVMGYHACEVLEKFSHKIIRMMQKLDKRGEAEMKQNQEVFDADEIPVDILPKKSNLNDENSIAGKIPIKDVAASSKKSVTISEPKPRKANKRKEIKTDDASVTSDLSDEDVDDSKLDLVSSVADNHTKDGTSILTNTTGDNLSVEDTDIRRIFGSWQTVHPASQGKESQTNYFMLSTFNVARDHPASFALHHDVPTDDNESSSDEENALVLPSAGNEDGGFEESKMIQAQDAIRQKGMDILMKNSVSTKKSKKSKHPSQQYCIFENSTELAQQDPLKLRGKIVLLQEKEPMILFDVKDAMLQARQSKSHYFSIPNRENLRVVELTISILYQGVFTNTGYKLGRLAGSLFRLPEAATGTVVAALPKPVGYTPYDSVSPNLPNSLGRLVIFHKPKLRPLSPGNFQIVIGTAAQTKYSIQVMAKYAKAALPVVDDEVAHAKTIQSRLPVCLFELDTIIESIQLSERKLLVCEKLIEEAESEAMRCQESIKSIRQQLIKDDEELFLLEDERKNLIRECNIFEIEYSQWTQLLGSRHQEKVDIREGITEMIKYQREHEQEKQNILQQLEKYRHDLPACIRILRNMTEAVNVAQSLNTIVQSVNEEVEAAATGDFGAIKLTTPAEDVRRVMKQYGFDALHLEEQQWSLLDQALNPNVYDWLREQEEQERILNIKLGKKVKLEKKLSPALEPFKMSKSEVEYVLQTPFSMLTRREMIVRKLLTKYHDDHEKLKRAISSVNLAFDPHLAERVRSKHIKSYTKEEQEWSTIDLILHPDIWNYYVNRSENFLDRHAKEADLESQSNTNTKKTTHEEKKALLKQLQAKQELASIDESSITTETSSTVTTANPPTVIKLENPEEDFQAVVERMQRQASIALRKRADSGKRPDTVAVATTNKPWTCQLDKEQILKIWRTPKHLLQTDDERKIYKLLHKYNGSYTAYVSLLQESNKRKENFVKVGAHIQWDKLGKIISKDSDFRARQLYREIDRAANTKNDFIHSEVLHMNDQKFPTKVLRQHLEEALDHLLSEQIKDRERAALQQFRKSSMYDVGDDEDNGVVDPQDKRNNTLTKEEKAPFTIDGINEKNKREDIFAKVQKLSEKREQRKVRLKEIDEEKEVMQAKKQLFIKQQEKQFKKEQKTAILKKLLQNEDLTADDPPVSQKSEAPQYKNELQLLQQYELSISCLACRTRKCKWRSFINLEILQDRIQELNNEIERVRLNKHANVFESEIPLSTQLGGNKIFTKGDLLQELYFEIRQINLQIELNNVDKELHDCYATRKEYFESQYLHGYKILLWTNHARIALEGRQSRLVAQTVSNEIVEDILESMLEGWIFGERESEYQVMGYVPSIKKNGFIHPGQDQISSVVNVIEKMKKRALERKQKLERSEEVRGKMLDKVYEIELRAQENKKQKKVARDNNDHEHLLNETESTLRFGLFMLTLMYFRAMVFLRREQSSWEGNDDAVKDPTNPKNRKVMTNERIKMLQEEHRVKLRQKKIELILAKSKIGEARKLEREKNERREAIRKLQAVVRRQKLEANSITLLQKVYRGHLGRKAAKRWALKRAELQAMNALLNATAINIQRVYRGYRGRLYTTLKRQEMAQFIALMRVQEAQQDEEIYWQTHPWSRFKKKQREWFQAKLQDYQTRGILGASRLQADELAELEGKTIDQIRRELDGLDASDDEGGTADGTNDEASGYQGGGSLQPGKNVFSASSRSSLAQSSFDASEMSSSTR